MALWQSLRIFSQYKNKRNKKAVARKKAATAKTARKTEEKRSGSKKSRGLQLFFASRTLVVLRRTSVYCIDIAVYSALAWDSKPFQLLFNSIFFLSLTMQRTSCVGQKSEFRASCEHPITNFQHLSWFVSWPRYRISRISVLSFRESTNKRFSENLEW